MNRFRGRKKKEDAVAPRPAVEPEASGPFKMFGGKKKSQEEEPKKELDLTGALPSNDEFRTSLLMTGLSARFSMLREQDDPNTKVGKASDDSVLFPKRQSRMMDFGYGAGLSDIAEVESIKGAGFARVHSFVSSDDAASTSGSIMSRAKPTEGNNLFGGRQKIYKIPAGGASKNGGLPGRALYEDDVALSAFQKWRQTEKERGSFEEDVKDDPLESETARPESPSHPEYNSRRETNSTMSSGPSAARNSTAATSITSSQPSSSVKDWMSTGTTSNAIGSIPPPERSVTRTRRLYEQGLNQDLHDQQSSALSRIDTLSKQRTFGTRTPDLTPTIPSPTSGTFSDRFGGSRSILSKASAPNLRSFSPPTTGSAQMSPIDGNSKFQRTSFGATPPLSPPISETGEHATLTIAPNDRGKATAMGVFSKPAQQYDETRYAQRQIQLQQGRETPTNRFRNDSIASNPPSRSRSTSSHRTSSEKKDVTNLKPEPTVEEEGQGSTFFDDDDDDQSVDDEPVRPEPLPQVTLERPDDLVHPAFRKSALPTPLSLKFRPSDGPSPITERPELSNQNSTNASPEDSPTLGPTSGLSGMVRQHLRNDSGASSVYYDSVPNDGDSGSRSSQDRSNSQDVWRTGGSSNSWGPNDWALSADNDPSPTTLKAPAEPANPAPKPPSMRDSKSDYEEEQENDEFARHLADGARRIRERLTSYVESDSGKSEPPPPPIAELPPPPRQNALGILKSKSSRGSLIDRSRMDKEAQSQSKAKKLLGIGTSTMATSPSARKSSFEMNDELSRKDKDEEQGSDQGRSSVEKDEGVHAGLKAFRQARRELQRMKELEVQQRYQAGQKPPGTREQPPSAAPSQGGSRPPSQERRPPPVSYNRMPSEEGRNAAGSRAGSRSGSRAPSERDRSGSETSNGGRSGSRPPRMRNGSIPRDDPYSMIGAPNGPNGAPRQGPMLRSPGLPGQDIKRSPHMPPQPYPNGNASPSRFNRSESAQNLTVQPYTSYEHGQPSPISPLNGAPSPYGPHGMASTRYLGQSNGGNMDPLHPGNRMLRARDASEPSFNSILPQGPGGRRDASQGPRGRSGSLIGAAASTPNLLGNMTAPPLPPINPRRKNNAIGGFGRGNEDEATMSSPHLPLMSGKDALESPTAEEAEGPMRFRQKLRKVTSEANGMNSRARSMRNSPPQPMNRPPLPPGIANNTTPGGMI